MLRDAEQEPVRCLGLNGIRRDIAECCRMEVAAPAARECCEKAGGRGDTPWNHGGRWRRRQVWRWKTSWKAEDESGVEAESETERHGVRRFLLQFPGKT